MAMTMEQKVAKKGKGKDKLKYQKGLAIVLLSVNETASEYDSDTEYKVRMYFKSKVAIKRVSDLLGSFKFNKKSMLEQYERGMKYTDLTLSSFEMFSLEAGNNIEKQVDFTYHNHHTGEHYSVTLNPTTEDDFSNYRTGSTADSEPLSDYFNYLKEAINKGDKAYIG